MKKNVNVGGFKINKYVYYALIIILFIAIGVIKIGFSSNQPDATDSSELDNVKIDADSGATTDEEDVTESPGVDEKIYAFRTEKQAKEHFDKHGSEFPYSSLEDYIAGANSVINNPDALTKTEKEDGDFIYYVEKTNEFVVVSTDGYIRTYFKPSAGKSYYERQ